MRRIREPCAQAVTLSPNIRMPTSRGTCSHCFTQVNAGYAQLCDTPEQRRDGLPLSLAA
jgi:hypothetical protein